jgi:quercetin dioxygenase-like cupin family protein
MEIFLFDRDERLISAHGSIGLHATRIASGNGAVSVTCLAVEPGGIIGAHPAVGDQLFLVIAGSGWVAGADGIRHPVQAGQGVRWAAGEVHASVTDTSLTALAVEGSSLRLFAELFGEHVPGRGRGVGVGNAEGSQDALSHRQVLLGTALGQSSGTGDDPRILDHLVAGELLAGPVDLGSVGQQVPVVHSLATAVGPEHLGDQQVASEQVVDGQRGRPALPTGRVGRGPIIRVNGIARIERPGCAYRCFQSVSG